MRPWWALDLHTLRVAATEALAYGSLLLVCLAIRRFVLARIAARVPTASKESSM